VSFEEAEKELAGIVEKLESGTVPLDDALALWERGEELYRLCREQLDAAQGKVEELARRVEEAKPAGGPPPV
jgi:exodeoxyribonuclease VII small subunit